MKPLFYVNYLTPSQVLNTWCEIIHRKTGFIRNTVFTDTHYACSMSNPIYLTFLRSLFVFVNITFFSLQRSFCFFVATGCFSFDFGFFCLYLTLFFGILVFYSFFCCNFFEGELIMISSSFSILTS